MFKSFHSSTIDNFVIVDDKLGEFECERFVGAGAIFTAIIQEYGKRNLPIAKNLIMCYKYLLEQHPTVQLNLLYHINHDVWKDIFAPYKKEFDKYLPFNIKA
jgi:site-specific DNA-adenine methylase